MWFATARFDDQEELEKQLVLSAAERKERGLAQPKPSVQKTLLHDHLKNASGLTLSRG